MGRSRHPQAQEPFSLPPLNSQIRLSQLSKQPVPIPSPIMPSPVAPPYTRSHQLPPLTPIGVSHQKAHDVATPYPNPPNGPLRRSRPDSPISRAMSQQHEPNPLHSQGRIAPPTPSYGAHANHTLGEAASGAARLPDAGLARRPSRLNRPELQQSLHSEPQRGPTRPPSPAASLYSTPRVLDQALHDNSRRDSHSAYTGPQPYQAYGMYPPPQVPRQEPQFLYAPPPVISYAAATGTKKRTSRASQACDQCRARKSKCNEGEPCTHCSSMDVECTYKDSGPPLRMTDKTINAALAEVLEAIKAPMSALEQKVDLLNHRLNQLQPQIAQQAIISTSVISGSLEGEDHERWRSIVQLSPGLQADETMSKLETAGFDNFDEHTTAAHKLIRFWPTVNAMLKEDLPCTDHTRTLPRLSRRGELDDMGEDIIDADAQQLPSPSNTNSMPPSRAASAMTFTSRDPGLAAEQDCDLRPSTVRRLFENYRRKIHVMHPFIDITSLEWFMAHALGQQAGEVQNWSTGNPYSADHGNSALYVNKKRKRSDASVETIRAEHDPQFSAESIARHPFECAVLYLVLALGRVIEEPYPVNDFSDHNIAGLSPVNRKRRRELASGRSGFLPAQHPQQHYVDSLPCNSESAPSLAYYREACVILGTHADSNTLGCAQARLLAGLYKGQLARVRESWSWIHDASRICRYLIAKHKLNKGSAQMHIGNDRVGLSRMDNIVLILSWSCLQLESDILAEFDYPHSGLCAHEAALPYPRLRFCEDATAQGDAEGNRKIEHHYLGQLYLRKRLNEMHANLYGKSLSLLAKDDLVEVLEKNEAALDSWKEMSVKMNVSIEQWTDDDEPSSDLLTARLRAKYYGARYIALRPFLDYALHAMDQNKAGRSLEEVTIDTQGRQRYSELALFEAISTMRPSIIREKVKTCIRSAIQSTVAFDRVEGRLTVTNIVGTAHAQFGNMLVLAATYDSGAKWLSDLIPVAKLRELLTRTLTFLEMIQFSAPTARRGLEILRLVQLHLFSVMNRARVDQHAASFGRMRNDHDWQNQPVHNHDRDLSMQKRDEANRAVDEHMGGADSPLAM